MVAHQSPGVYLTEAPLTSPPEQLGAAVAVGMFVGAAPKGPIDTPTRLDSWSDYVTRFGGFDKIEGIDANVANAPTAVYVRATTTGTASNSTGGIVGAKKGDLAFVNAYRGTKGTFYKYVSGESAQPGFNLPHSIYVFDGTAWQDTGYRWNSQSKLFRDRTDILGGISPAVNIVLVSANPTLTAPIGITPAYGDIALRWDSGTSTFLAYTYGNANSTYFNGTGASEGSGTLTVTATIRPDADRLVHVAARIEGRITSVPAKLGDKVRAGQLLGIAVIFLRNQIRPILKLAEAAEKGHWFTVRAAWNRVTQATGRDKQYLRERMAKAKKLGTYSLEVAPGPGRSARTARMVAHAAEVTLRLRNKATGKITPLPVRAVWVHEKGTIPRGERSLAEAEGLGDWEDRHARQPPVPTASAPRKNFPHSVRYCAWPPGPAGIGRTNGA